MKMNMATAMRAYGRNDKEYFPCFNGFDNADRPNTTFFADFCVAEVYGEKGIRETFDRAFNGWKDSPKMFTELSVVLNHLLWNHYADGEESIARIYDELWRKTDAHAKNAYKDEDLNHYLSVID